MFVHLHQPDDAERNRDERGKQADAASEGEKEGSQSQSKAPRAITVGRLHVVIGIRAHAGLENGALDAVVLAEGNIGRTNWLAGAVNFGAKTVQNQNKYDPVTIDQVGLGQRQVAGAPAYEWMRRGHRGLERIMG